MKYLRRVLAACVWVVVAPFCALSLIVVAVPFIIISGGYYIDMNVEVPE
jgi:hypothetical protein